MPLNTKTIKRRIKSVGSTRKITRAMEMISAVKMRKAAAAVLASRAYAKLAWEVLSDIAGRANIKEHPLLARRPVKKVGLIFITSNRGLAGGFTSRLLQEAHQYIQKEEVEEIPSLARRGRPAPSDDGGVVREDAATEIILMGRRGQRLYTRFGHSIASEFEKVDLTASVAEILPLTEMVINDYVNGQYDKVAIAYTDFVSAVKLVPRVKQLLPIIDVIASPDGHREGSQSYNRGEEGLSDIRLQRIDKIVSSADGHRLPRNDNWGYGFKYEPNAKQVLDNLLPRLIEMQIYQAVLESDASEHSCRMMAMKNASEAAEEMITELQFNYNKARQAAITQEIAEIVGAVAAME